MTSNDTDNARTLASERQKAKRGFIVHAAAYVLFNLAFIITWAVRGRGRFWPIQPIVGWGFGLAMHGWAAFFGRPGTADGTRPKTEHGR